MYDTVLLVRYGYFPLPYLWNIVLKGFLVLVQISTVQCQPSVNFLRKKDGEKSNGLLQTIKILRLILRYRTFVLVLVPYFTTHLQ